MDMDVTRLILIYVLQLGGIIFAGLSLYFGLHADDEYRQDGVYFPVSIKKFIVMNIITYGSYVFFWSWKFWRWGLENRKLKVLPFWRALFCNFLIYAKIGAINKEIENKFTLAQRIEIAVYGIVMIVVDYGYRWYFEDDTLVNMIQYLFSFVLLAVVIYLPLVVKVNEINGVNSKALKNNSEFNIWNIMGMIIFVAFVLVAVLK